MVWFRAVQTIGGPETEIGQEAVAAGVGEAMRPDDLTFCTYRGHAHTLTRGASMTALMAELLGRAKLEDLAIPSVNRIYETIAKALDGARGMR